MKKGTHGRLQRLAEVGRPEVRFWFDGQEITALEGDTILTAVLLSAKALRDTEFGPEKRAGFCLMGACQDCWIWDERGPRMRACSTQIQAGMRLLSRPPVHWPEQLTGDPS